MLLSNFAQQLERKSAEMARLKIPFLIFFAFALSGVLGFWLRTDVRLISSDASIQTLDARFVDPRPAATGVADGFIDRQYFIEPNIHVIEGWAIFPQSNASLLVYSGETSQFGGAFRFRRQDLAGKPGSQGFVFYGRTSENSGNQWCVVIPIDNTLLQLGGKNC